MRLIVICVFLFLFCTSFHKPTANKPNTKKIVNVPVLSMYEECSLTSPYESQTVYGKTVSIVDRVDEDWGLISSEEGYQGYALLKHLADDDILWRASNRIYTICSLAARVYPISDTERPALLTLPYGAKVYAHDGLSAPRWIPITLVDGQSAWIQRGDIEEPKQKTLEDLLDFSAEFLGRPYIWGGSSSEGFDCSGFIQMLYQQIGLQLPRDSKDQAACSDLYEISKNDIQPGDIVFMGNPRIYHVGMYVGNDLFIHSGVKNNLPKINYMDFDNPYYVVSKIMRVRDLSFEGSIHPIHDEIRAHMTHSWNDNNPVPIDDLRYIQLTHWGFDGCIHEGEIIVHKKVADEVLEIFEELFSLQYPIEKMLLIDEYEANDYLACADNNSSAFCSRQAVGKNEWSYHSYGLAIDINTQLNPYHRGDVVIPENGKVFLDRTLDYRGIITEDDACYQAFAKRGWLWGGHWNQERGYVDYQHFYKEL